MTQTKTMILKGIQRNNPQGTVEACDDMVNMRMRDGAREPVGKKNPIYPKPPYDLVRIHKMDSVTNFIGYDLVGKTVFWYHPGILLIHQTVVALNGTETLVAIKNLKLFLLIVTTERVYYFLYKEGAYMQIDLNGLELNFYTTPVAGGAVINQTTDPVLTTEGLAGKYYELLNKQSDAGFFWGGMFYRMALRLYDGTEIMHTVPSFYQASNMGGEISRGNLGYILKLFELNEVKINASFIESLGGGSLRHTYLTEVISSIVVYASRILPLYDISESTIASATLPALNATKSLGDMFAVSEDYKGMADSVNWYKIAEVPFKDLIQQAAPFDYRYAADMKMDMKGFYENYATRPLMQVDNFSHHTLTGNNVYLYNSRLHLMDTVQTVQKPYNLGLFYVPSVEPKIGSTVYVVDAPNYYETLVQVKLNTSDGVKLVNTTGSLTAYRDTNDASKKAVFLSGLIGYFDSRAAEISVNIKIGSLYYNVLTTPLTPSLFQNFAYAVFKTFEPLVTQDIDIVQRRVDANFISWPLPFVIANLVQFNPPAEDRVVHDNNRVQPSEVDNPFVFPVKNSQQVSTGKVLALGTNTEDVSSAQFGAYPMYCFTSEGIWGISIGTGDIYFTRIDPLSGEVLRDSLSVLDLPFGVAFATSEGLKIISGKEVVNISDPVDGKPDKYIRQNANLQFFLDHLKLVTLIDYMDTVPFKTYLVGAGLYMNKGFERAEIVINNPAYNYSYVYDVEARDWYRITGSYSVWVPTYPELYVVDNDANFMVNFSKEVDGNVQCMFITRAQSFGAIDAFKKLRRTFFRCHLNTATGKFAAGYMFESDDLKKWTLITGNDRNSGEVKDIWVTHSLHSAKYHLYVFVGELAVSEENTNIITVLQTEVDLTRESKLR
jgi:hypothetical protein